MVRIEREGGVRVDLHLHSRASGTATNIWVQGTLTDHETIGGALTLVHHADFFVSEEISACFPEDGTCVDVLVYGLDAEVHAEAQARRGDVYDLVGYLREVGGNVMFEALLADEAQ